MADLLPDRSAASFAAWLREHPGVRIISRDRDGIYAEGGRAGAPRAKQVADRFHLIQNLSQAVQDELAHQRDRLLMPAQEFSRNTAPVDALKPEPEIIQPHAAIPARQEKDHIRQQRWRQQVQLFEMVKGLHAQGLRAIDIVRQTGISRGRVDKWLRLEQCPPRSRKTPRPGMAEDFREPLLRLWKRGYHRGADLLMRIRKLGYIGSLTSLNRFLAPWRAAKRAAKRANWRGAGRIEHSITAASVMRHISPQEAAALLGKAKPMLTKRQSKIVEFLKRTPKFARMRRLLLSFRTILCRGKVSSLRRWTRQAKAAGITPISRFVRQLKKDWKAVENAVKQVWSNGPAEGHINRLKMLKRQMYGRAGVELLRARLLPCPQSQLQQI